MRITLQDGLVLLFDCIAFAFYIPFFAICFMGMVPIVLHGMNLFEGEGAS